MWLRKRRGEKIFCFVFVLRGERNRKRELGQLVREEGIWGEKEVFKGNGKNVLLAICDATLLPLMFSRNEHCHSKLLEEY